MKYKHEFLMITDRHNPERSGQLSFSDVATICDVTLKTVKRWANGTQSPHPAAYRLLQMYAFGEIPLLNPGGFSKIRVKKRGYGDKSDRPVLVNEIDDELSAVDVNYYADKLKRYEHWKQKVFELKDECSALKMRVAELEHAKVKSVDNVVAFAPYLRRKESVADRGGLISP